MGHADTWVVVPAFNEAAQIAHVVAELREEFDHVLVVDDGSTDETAALGIKHGAVVVSHPVNLGQGAALQTGFDFVRRVNPHGWLVTFDADGQHLIEDAVAMLATARNDNVDIVLGSRFTGAAVAMPWVRRRLLRAAVLFTRVTTGLDLSDAHNGLRVINTRVLPMLALRQPRMAYASELTSAISRHRLSWREAPTTVLYTEYSKAKGQRNINALNIVFDLVAARIRPAA